jgi:hypothetical protein
VAEPLILDSEALHALAHASRRSVLADRARAILGVSHEEGALVRVPAPVLAEVFRGSPADAPVHRVHPGEDSTVIATGDPDHVARLHRPDGGRTNRNCLRRRPFRPQPDHRRSLARTRGAHPCAACAVLYVLPTASPEVDVQETSRRPAARLSPGRSGWSARSRRPNGSAAARAEWVYNRPAWFGFGPKANARRGHDKAAIGGCPGSLGPWRLFRTNSTATVPHG